MDQGYEIVTSGRDLARRITARGRTKPAAVVAWHPGMPQNRIDIGRIAREVGALAEVFWLENGPESYIFSDFLPPMADVYGNAARVYAPDLRWLEDARRSPLRMASSRDGALRAAEDILDDVLRLVSVAPARRPAAGPPRRARGTVKAFASAGSRAIVELEDGTRCTIQREHVVPPVRLDWMLAAGQQVEGEFNDEDKTLDIRALKLRPRLAELYRPGDLVLALAERVTAEEAVLTLFPGFSRRVTADRISSNPLDTADSLVTEGDVVVARFLHDCGAVVLSLIDVDDDAEVKHAPALLDGGTPWLQAGRHLVDAATSARTSAAASGAGAAEEPAGPAGGTSAGSDPRTRPSTALLSVQLQLEAERRKVAQLQEVAAVSGRAGAELVAAQKEQGQLRLELEAARQDAGRTHAALVEAATRLDQQAEQLRNQRTRYRQVLQSLNRSAEDPAEWFGTDEERLRHDVYLAWARNTPASEKARLRLPDRWDVGPDCAGSIYSFTEPGVRAKALKAAVDVLTGAAERHNARELHPLRENGGGDAPPVRRSDGARCFRAAIERNVAAARRLHYWKRPDGTVELSRVVVHDDFRP